MSSLDVSKNSYITSILPSRCVSITVKTLLTFSTFLLLPWQEEAPLVSHRLSFYLMVNNTESIYVSVTSHEIWTLIGSFSVRKSSVPYSVPVTILKSIRDESLAFLVNASFTSGNFPDKLKLAGITPTFKKDWRFDKDI